MQFQLDAETLSHSLERLSSTLDPQSLSNKSNPEILLALEVRFRGEDVSIQGEREVWRVSVLPHVFSSKFGLFQRKLVYLSELWSTVMPVQ